MKIILILINIENNNFLLFLILLLALKISIDIFKSIEFNCKIKITFLKILLLILKLGLLWFPYILMAILTMFWDKYLHVLLLGNRKKTDLVLICVKKSKQGNPKQWQELYPSYLLLLGQSRHHQKDLPATILNY